MFTKLVVINENTLGYILPYQSNIVHVLKGLVSKGASVFDGCMALQGVVRLACESDFDVFNVCFDGYKNSDAYLYAVELDCEPKRVLNNLLNQGQAFRDMLYNKFVFKISFAKGGVLHYDERILSLDIDSEVESLSYGGYIVYYVSIF